jgi:transcriptional regulator with XRE-family HTH domain
VTTIVAISGNGCWAGRHAALGGDRGGAGRRRTAAEADTHPARHDPDRTGPATGISKSTLSRLEGGQRKPSLELLLPIAQAHRIPLEELVGAPEVGDPRVRFTPRRRNGRIVVPLTRNPGGLQAWKTIIPPEQGQPELRTHEGHEWFYVLAGRVRLILAGHDLTLGPGEVAEFDTRLPHWFGPADDQPVEILSLLGRQGERIHVRAAPRRADS